VLGVPDEPETGAVVLLPLDPLAPEVPDPGFGTRATYHLPLIMMQAARGLFCVVNAAAYAAAKPTADDGRPAFGLELLKHSVVVVGPPLPTETQALVAISVTSAWLPFVKVFPVRNPVTVSEPACIERVHTAWSAGTT
jgi:hypothetical protein